MTQPEFPTAPTISFTHYLDLLKRRTWHVVTLSILGLLVGAVVALMIPRFYVARTTVQFNRPILDPLRGTPQDPMAQVVDDARVTVPAGVDHALAELLWPEARIEDYDRRRAFIEGVRRRVGVEDGGPHNPGRQIAILYIVYRDTNRERAAELTNKLRDIWLKNFVDALEEKARAGLTQMQDRIGVLVEAQRDAAKAIEIFERDNNINPADWYGLGKGQITILSAEVRQLERRLDELVVETVRLENLIGVAQGQLELLPPQLAVSILDRLDPVDRAEYQTLRVKQLGLVSYLKNIKPAHSGFTPAQNMLEVTSARIDELEATAGDVAAEQENPAYTSIEATIRQLQASLEGKEVERALLRRRLEKKQGEMGLQPGIVRRYRELRARMDRAVVEENALNEQRRGKEEVMRRIRTESPYDVLRQAFAPTRPTDPSPFLVALLGSVIGLSVAVGLVFVIDLLQSTYKTVSDVEGALEVPILGTMSYMETAAERESHRTRRLRLTIASTIFIALLVTVVTLYYVQPTSLPEVIRDLLDLMLGAPGK